MTVGQENIAYPMECARCNYQWLALVEASKIEWKCPKCGHWTEINRSDV